MLVWRKILAHGLKRLATPALHLWRIRHGLVEELALCIKSLATPGVNKTKLKILFDLGVNLHSLEFAFTASFFVLAPLMTTLTF